MVELQGAVLPAEACTVPGVLGLLCLVAFSTSHRRHLDTTRMLIASKECDSFTYRAQRQAPGLSLLLL